MNNDHLSPEEIKSYVDFKFGDHDNERIISHLSECEKCLLHVDEKWSEKAMVAPKLSSDKLEKRLLNKIHRSNLAGSFIRLAIMGFFSTIIGVITPLLKSNTTKLTNKK